MPLGSLHPNREVAVPEKFRNRLTFANVVSVLALFVALGGSSYAAIQVTGKNVKNSSLTGRDIKNSSLTSSDVKNRSLLSKDFKRGQLPAGPRGADGANGTNGFGLLSYPFGTSPPVTSGSDPDAAFIACDPGTFPTGGDAFAFGPDPDNDPIGGVITSDGVDIDPATGAPDGWFATWENNSPVTVTIEIDAICANATTVQAKAKRVQLRPKHGKR
jgi:hypothetical protein